MERDGNVTGTVYGVYLYRFGTGRTDTFENAEIGL